MQAANNIQAWSSIGSPTDGGGDDDGGGAWAKVLRQAIISVTKSPNFFIKLRQTMEIRDSKMHYS